MYIYSPRDGEHRMEVFDETSPMAATLLKGIARPTCRCVTHGAI